MEKYIGSVLTIISVIIGGLFTLIGTLLSYYLKNRKEKKEKLRIAKSLIVSNTIGQIRRMERAVDLNLKKQMNSHIIKNIENEKIKYFWSLEYLEKSDLMLLEELNQLWLECNVSDTELIHNLAILESLDSKIAEKISFEIQNLISWNLSNVTISEDETFKFIDKKVTYLDLYLIKKNKLLSEIYAFHNIIVKELGTINLLIKI